MFIQHSSSPKVCLQKLVPYISIIPPPFPRKLTSDKKIRKNGNFFSSNCYAFWKNNLRNKEINDVFGLRKAVDDEKLKNMVFY